MYCKSDLSRHSLTLCYITLIPELSAVSWFHIWSSLGGVCCAQGQAEDCSWRQSSSFSRVSRGTKTHWRSELRQKGSFFFFIYSDTHSNTQSASAEQMDSVRWYLQNMQCIYLFMHCIHLFMCCLSPLFFREILLQAPLLLPFVWLCSAKEACSIPCSSHR